MDAQIAALDQPLSTDESFKDKMLLLLLLRRFASDTSRYCLNPYNICGEASTIFYSKEQSF